MPKYKVGQPVIYVSSNISPTLSFGVITETENKKTGSEGWLTKYPYYIMFSDQADDDYFSENAVEEMVKDYERFQNGEYEED